MRILWRFLIQMGSKIEINDTLKISKERGFPKELRFENHVQAPESSQEFIGKEFEFWNPEERLYHRPPTRVFLVEEINGRWLYWGNALIIEQTIKQGETLGKYKIIKIYQPDFQKRITIEESPRGKSYFQEDPKSFFS